MKRIYIILIACISLFSCETSTTKPTETAAKKELSNCLKASYLKEVLVNPPFGLILDEKKGSEFSATNKTIRGYEIIGDDESPHYYIQYDPTTDEIYNFGFEINLANENVNPKIEDVAKLFEVGAVFDSSAASYLKNNFKPIFYTKSIENKIKETETKNKGVWMGINHSLFVERELMQKDKSSFSQPHTITLNINNTNKPLINN